MKQTTLVGIIFFQIETAEKICDPEGYVARRWWWWWWRRWRLGRLFRIELEWPLVQMWTQLGGFLLRRRLHSSAPEEFDFSLFVRNTFSTIQHFYFRTSSARRITDWVYCSHSGRVPAWLCALDMWTVVTARKGRAFEVVRTHVQEPVLLAVIWFSWIDHVAIWYTAAVCARI